MAGLSMVWSTVREDTAEYSGIECAELVLDRATGGLGEEVDALIVECGYDAVLELVANIMFGGK